MVVLEPLLVIVGPTGVGKTETAIAVAKALGGEIVSADSRQIYAGLAIGSGAPSREQLSSVQHHLVGSQPIEDRLTAGDFAANARSIIGGIREHGGLPIVVGGAGLYLRALIDGLANVPPSSPEVRAGIEAEIVDRGYQALREDLAAVDPEYAELVGPRDRKRLVRALEVYRLTNRTSSDWHHDQTRDSWCSPVMFGLERPRPELREIIRQRVESMIAFGWGEEVRGLIEGDGLPSAALEAVGYHQLARYLDGQLSFDEAKMLAITATRQFAKRQMTWFRADSRIRWLEGTGPDAPHIWADQIMTGWKNANLSGSIH